MSLTLRKLGVDGKICGWMRGGQSCGVENRVICCGLFSKAVDQQTTLTTSHSLAQQHPRPVLPREQLENRIFSISTKSQDINGLSWLVLISNALIDPSRFLPKEGVNSDV